MSVSNGQLANQTTFNGAFASKSTLNQDLTGTYNLKNPSSGGDITDVQQTLNTAITDIANAEVDIASLQANKVTGPASATDNALVRYDSTTGKLVQDSGVTVDDSGNMIVPGDLTVGGTTTSINTVNLDVTDKNILVNNGGDDTTAQGAGLTVERSTVNGSFVYDSALASKWKIGDVGSEVEVLDKSSSQIITNKTIVAANNTITTAPSGALTSTELNAALAELQSDITALGTPSDYILKSIVTTKGDLIAATASATVSRLGVGTNGQVLSADSAESTGLKWITPSTNSFTVLKATSSVKTATGANNYHQMTGNSVSLTVGTWVLSASTAFLDNGTTPAYTTVGVGIFGANGADSSSIPTSLASTPNLTVESAVYTSGLQTLHLVPSSSSAIINSPIIYVTVTTTVTIYAVPFSNHTTSANTRITSYINARKLV